MSDATLRIKNLSIALEALSHVTGDTPARLSIEELLQEEIHQFRKEKEKETQWPHYARPANPTTNDNIPF